MAKYRQVKANLKARLLDGTYREGRALPSEESLAAEFEVARMTVRRALDELEAEGYLLRAHGSGTYPTGRHFRQGAFKLQSLSELAGERPVFTRVLHAGLVHAEPEVAAALNLDAGAAVVRIERLRGIDDAPLILERRSLPADLAERLLGRNLTGESIHERLVSDLGVSVSAVRQTLQAVSVGDAEAGRLALLPGSAAFLLTRLTLTDERVVSLAHYWVRGDAGIFTSSFAP